MLDNSIFTSLLMIGNNQFLPHRDGDAGVSVWNLLGFSDQP